MPIRSEVAELILATNQLRHSVELLMSKFGDTPAMRRIANDASRIGIGIERLEIDLHEMHPTCVRTEPERPREMIQIPDTPYDVHFWRDVDHEGIGGQR